MVRGYNHHTHVILPKLGQAGHFRTAVVDEGAMVYLPVKK